MLLNFELLYALNYNLVLCISSYHRCAHFYLSWPNSGVILMLLFNPNSFLRNLYCIYNV